VASLRGPALRRVTPARSAAGRQRGRLAAHSVVICGRSFCIQRCAALTSTSLTDLEPAGRRSAGAATRWPRMLPCRVSRRSPCVFSLRLTVRADPARSSNAPEPASFRRLSGGAVGRRKTRVSWMVRCPLQWGPPFGQASQILPFPDAETRTGPRPILTGREGDETSTGALGGALGGGAGGAETSADGGGGGGGAGGAGGAGDGEGVGGAEGGPGGGLGGSGLGGGGLGGGEGPGEGELVQKNSRLLTKARK
jgi:hypothetical protein